MALAEHLAASAATAEFARAVESFMETGCGNERVVFPRTSPSVKVERTLTKILQSIPHLPIEKVEIVGHSGCEFFRGEAVVFAGSGEARIEFHWDCKWKALELGWKDYFGFPDQVRAAREFGFDCFREWKVMPLQLLA
jgi:hypothetical protein